MVGRAAPFVGRETFCCDESSSLGPDRSGFGRLFPPSSFSAVQPRYSGGASERGGGCKKSLYLVVLRGDQLPFSKGDNNVAKGFLCVFASFT